MTITQEILIELGVELDHLKALTKKKPDNEYNRGLIAGLETADKFINYFFAKQELKRSE